jgi:hypothetical protein
VVRRKWRERWSVIRDGDFDEGCGETVEGVLDCGDEK